MIRLSIAGATRLRYVLLNFFPLGLAMLLQEKLKLEQKKQVLVR
jgi:hypothetical protein